MAVCKTEFAPLAGRKGRPVGLLFRLTFHLGAVLLRTSPAEKHVVNHAGRFVTENSGGMLGGNKGRAVARAAGVRKGISGEPLMQIRFES